MTNVPEDSRIEVKFVAHHSRYHDIIHWLQLHNACFRTAYPERWINNIYFDSTDLNSYTSSLSGISVRSKLRLRWYCDMKSPEMGNLELKCKWNLFNWKRIYPLHTLPDFCRDNWKSSIIAIMDCLPHDGRELLSSRPKPIIINRYNRKYFVSHDGYIRITIDTHLGVWDQRYTVSPNMNSKAMLPDMMVVEAKFSRQHHSLATQYLATIPMRSSRHSKYINGVSAVSGRGVWF